MRNPGRDDTGWALEKGRKEKTVGYRVPRVDSSVCMWLEDMDSGTRHSDSARYTKMCLDFLIEQP